MEKLKLFGMKLVKGLWKTVKGFFFILYRILVVSLVLCLVVIVISAGAIKFLVTPESLKPLLADALRGVLHRPVSVEEVSIGLFQGVRVKKLRVGTLDRFRDMNRDFLSSDLVVAEFKWLPLLKGRIVLDSLRLVRPKIEIFRLQDGTWNIQDLMDSLRSLSRPYKSPVSFFSVTLSEFQISNARLIYEDAARQSRHTIESFNLDVSDFSLSSPFEFQLFFESSQLVGGGQLQGDFSTQGTLTLGGSDFSKARLDIPHMRVRVNGINMDWSVEAGNFLEPQAQVRFGVSPFFAERLRPWWEVRPDAFIPKAQGEFHLSKSSDSVRLSSASLTLGDAQWKGEGEFSLKGDRAFRLASKGSNWDIRQLSEFWPALRERGLASGQAQWSVDIGSSSGKVRVHHLSCGIKSAYWENGDHNMHLPSVSFSSTEHFRNFSFSISKAYGQAWGRLISDLEMEGKAEAGHLALTNLSGGFQGTPVSIKASVKNYLSPKVVDVRARMDVLFLDAWIQLMQEIARGAAEKKAKPAPRKGILAFKYSLPREFPQIIARLQANEISYAQLSGKNIKAAMDLKGLTLGLKNLSGYLRFQMGPGNISDIEGLMSRDKILRATFLSFVTLEKINRMGIFSAKIAALKNLEYDRIFGDYEFNEGKLNVKSFFMDSSKVVMASEGAVDLVAEQINLHVVTRLKEVKSTGGLPEGFMDEEGKPALAFRVEGALQKPASSLDFSQNRSKTVDRALERAQKGVE